MPKRALRGEVSRPLRVDLVVLHRRVEVLLDDRAEAVYLVDEEHVARVEVRQKTRQVARLVQHGTRREPQLRPHFVGDDVGEGGLAQSRGAVQQHVVERVAAHERRFDEDAEIIDDLVLAGEVFELLRPDFVFEFEIAFGVAYDRHNAKITIFGKCALSRRKNPPERRAFRIAAGSCPRPFELRRRPSAQPDGLFQADVFARSADADFEFARLDGPVHVAVEQLQV